MIRERTIYTLRISLRLWTNNMDEKTIKAAESALAKGDRVELIPTRDGVKAVRIQREPIKK